MKVVFDLNFDGGAWPGPLQDRDAVVGEMWVGPAGFLGLLETQLGLGGPQQSNRARASALIPAVRNTDGFWSESAIADVLATARTLLRWRDHLWLYGWRGEPEAPRLAELAGVTADVAPGVADRLLAVQRQLDNHAAPIETIVCFDDPAELPISRRNILQRLADAGAEISVQPLKAAQARGDLAAALGGRFTPEGDGSLQLLRPYGPLAAAEEVAAWISSLPGDHGVVIINPDPVLDQALRRHGIPVTGAPESRDDNSLLQLLPLVLAMTWSPPDPRRAVELLTLPESPIPRGVRRRLLNALFQWPAIDSDAWRQNLEVGLSRLEDDAYRDRVADQIASIFEAGSDGARCSRSDVCSRAALVARWLRGRAETDETEPGKWHAAFAQCEELIRLVELSGLESLSAPQLQRFIESATSAAAVSSPAPAEAGVYKVAGPGAVVGPAKHVVWWSFNQGSAPSVSAPPFSRREREALAAIGVELPDPGRTATVHARHWRRPLLQATDHLVLVCPRHSFDGDEEYPHPLWDELIANASDSKMAVQAVVAETPIFASEPVRRQRDHLKMPSPTRLWPAPMSAIARRERESPSSIENLLRCSFKWVLEYCGWVRSGQSAQLPTAEKLIGRVVHEIVGNLLSDPPSSPDAAEAEAGRLFDTEGPRLAAELFLPGADAARGQARRITTASARDLVGLLQGAGLGVVAVESEYETNALGTVLRGRPDLIAGPPTAIVDLKHGGEKYRLGELEDGTALQLAAYAQIVDAAGGTKPAHAAFYILRSQRLLALEPSPFRHGEAIDGPSMTETWAATEQAYHRRWAEIESGELIAAGIAGEDAEAPTETDAVVDGVLALSPSCRFCDLGALCGRLFGGVS